MPNTDSSAHPQGLTTRVTLTICLPTCSPWRRRTLLQLTVKTAKGQMLSFPSAWIFCSGISGMLCVRECVLFISVVGLLHCAVVAGVAPCPCFTVCHRWMDRLLHVPCPGYLSQRCVCALRSSEEKCAKDCIYCFSCFCTYTRQAWRLNGLARNLGHMIKAFSF